MTIVNGLNAYPSIVNPFAEMDKSKIDFHLTGSRFFGDSRPDSDWDYYTMYTEESLALLRRLNFYSNENYEYSETDTSIATVMRNETYNIDVQLIYPHSITLKHKAQDMIMKFRIDFPELYALHNYMKQTRKKFWQTFLVRARKGLGTGLNLLSY